MAWFKVDDGFLTSSKVMSIPRSKRAEVLGVWLSVGVWSAHEMKDGIVPNSILEELCCTPEIREILIDVGMWIEHDLNSVQIHNWNKYQPTREQLENKSRIRSAAGSLGGKASVQAKLKQTSSKNQAIVKPEPEPEPNKELLFNEVEQVNKKDLYSEAFLQWWEMYPRKQSKGDAFKAWEVWRKRKLLPELKDLIDATKRYAETVSHDDPQFIKLPAGWLRDRKWEDESANSKPKSEENDTRRRQMEDWLSARGVTVDEYERRKNESGWLDSLKGMKI